MTGDRWTRLWEVFHDALERTPAEREAFAVEACGDDAGLLEEVRQLLRANERSAAFIEPPPRDPPSDQAVADGPGALVGGRFRVLRRLGEGGFADVFLAEQVEPLRRQVALKILKPGMDSRAIIARFEAERQMLAVLDHPGIARVYDAGLTEHARPYFAMEFIDGRPITAFARDFELSIPQRLELFAQVCDAVQHAHHKGLIHRDLKPSNVLVALAEAPDTPPQPRVKVIDFGVAKALAADDRAGTLISQGGQFIGTPEYMSPEQASGRTDDLDTRSDVYALGVMLYELLTGVLPFDSHTLRRAAAAEVQRIICERDPPRPSTRISRITAGQRTDSGADETAAATTRELRGDLDWIIMKALAKERDRRYDSPRALADDLQRHRRHEPVLAGPPSAAYRVSKFVRRNRAAVLASVLMLALLTAGVIATGWQAVRATRAEGEALKRAASEERLRTLADERAGEAERQTKIAQAVAHFLNRDILAAADPRNAVRTDITLREAVDAAAGKVGERFKDEPEVEAAVRRVLGDVFRSMGAPREALPHMERARDLYQANVGADDPRMLGTVNDLAILYQALGRAGDAEPLYRQGLESRRRMLGAEHRETIAAGINLASLYRSQGRPGEAETLLRECIEAMARANDPSLDDALILAKQHLSGVYFDAERFDEMEPLVTEVFEHHRATVGEDHPYAIAAMGSMARLYEVTQRLDDAEAMHARIIAASQRRLGPAHTETAMAMIVFGTFYSRTGRPEKGLPLVQEALGIMRAAVGETHPSTLAALNALANIYDQQQQWTQAEPYSAQAASGASTGLGADHWLRGVYLLNHGKVLNRLERWAESEPLLLEAQRILPAALGEASPHAIECCRALAYLYSKTDRMDLARAQQARREAATRPAQSQPVTSS